MDRVLEIGSGHCPNYRSDVLVEKELEDNSDRCGDVKIYAHQQLVHADGEDMPFRDKEFDYAICNQVLEHVEHPDRFIRELARVARRGYIETPSLIGEFLFPKRAHRWVILDIDDKLLFFEKSKLPGNYANDYGELFLNYLPYQSLLYKLLWMTDDGDMMLNRYEWKDNIDFIINPEDDYYCSFFLNKWTPEMVRKMFPPRGIGSELKSVSKALVYLLRRKIRDRLVRHRLLTMDEYLKIGNR